MRTRKFGTKGMSSLSDDLMEFAGMDDRVGNIRKTRQESGDAGPYWAWSLISARQASKPGVEPPTNDAA